MSNRKLSVEFIGNAKSLGHASVQARESIGGIGVKARETTGHLRHLAEVIGIAFAAEKVVEFGKESVKAAENEQTAWAKLEAQLKALGISRTAHNKQIEATTAKESQLSGFTKTELTGAFTNLVRTTHSVKLGLRDQALAADVARAKHIDLEAASKLVSKAELGQAGALKRVGIEAKTVTTHQDAIKKSLEDWKNAHGKLTPAIKAHFEALMQSAKAADLTATKQSLVATLQKNFAGQAKAYGDTAAGAQDRLHAAVESLQVSLGTHLLPVIAKVSQAVAGFVSGIQDGTGAGGKFRDIVSGAARAVGAAFEAVKPFLKEAFAAIVTGVTRAKAAVTRWVSENQPLIHQVMDAFRNIGIVVKDVAQTVFPILLAITRRVIPGVVSVIQGGFKVIIGVVRVFSSLLTGDFGGAWKGVKQIVSGALQQIVGAIRAITAPAREAAARIGSAVVGVFHSLGSRFVELGRNLMQGLINGITGIAGEVANAAKNVAKGAVDSVKGFLGIGSPSKVFHAIGVNIGEGLVGGLLSHKDAVAAGLTSSLIYPVDAAIAALTARKDALQRTWDAIDQRAQRSSLLQAISTARKGTIQTTTSGGRGSVNLSGLSSGGGSSIARTIVSVGQRMGASGKQILAAIEAGIVESGLRNLPYGDRDSVGVFQQRPSAGWHGLMNVPRAAAEFFQHALGINAGNITAGQLAQAVQGSAFPARYDQAAGQARSVLAGLGAKITGGGSGGSGGGSKTTSKRVVDASAVRDAIKALRDFDTQAAHTKRLARIDLQITNLQKLQAFKDAITGIGSRLKDMAANAAAAFRSQRESDIANGPLAQALAKMKAEDAAAADAKQKAQLDQALTDAKASGDVQAQKDAQDAIDAYARQKAEDGIQAQIDAQTSGLDTEESNYKSSLDSRLGALLSNLQSGKESYAQFARDVQGVLDGLHLPPGIPGFDTSPGEESTVNGGPGPAIPHLVGGPNLRLGPAPHHAFGGISSGAWSWVGERGPELVRLPAGARVYPADLSRHMGGGGGVGDVYLTKNGNVQIGSTEDAHKMAHKLAYKIATA